MSDSLFESEIKLDTFVMEVMRGSAGWMHGLSAREFERLPRLEVKFGFEITANVFTGLQPAEQGEGPRRETSF
jgi:hypothetical protein